MTGNGSEYRDDLEQYGVGEELQFDIVTMMMRRDGFLSRYREALRSEFFDKEPVVILARLVLRYFDQYRQPPSFAILSEEARREASRLSLPPDMEGTLQDWVAYIGSRHIPQHEADYISELVVRFGQRQAFRQALAMAVQKITSKEDGKALDLEALMGAMSKALKIGMSVYDLGIDFTKALPNLPQLLRDETAYTQKIRTPFPTLTNATQGGFGAGEIVVVMARPGKGKSWFGINCAVNAMLQDHDVIHLSIGDLHEIDVHMRYTCRWLGVTQQDILSGAEEFKRRSADLVARLHRSLRIKYMAPGVTSIGEVAGYIDRVVDEMGRHPGMVVIDYPDQLKGAVKENMYAAIGEIYDVMANIGTKHRCVVVAPSQVKREWGDGEVITKESIANSDMKSAKADIMLSLNANAEEARNHAMRLWLDKCRRGESNIIINLTTDYAKGILREVPQGASQAASVSPLMG